MSILCLSFVVVAITFAQFGEKKKLDAEKGR